VIVAERDAPRAAELLAAAGETVYRIGTIEPCLPGAPQAVIE
jgi:hypothetical protein